MSTTISVVTRIVSFCNCGQANTQYKHRVNTTMKHLVIPSMSIRKADQCYTTPGLGDMVHTVLIGFLYGQEHNTPVTLHLTSDKWNRDKPETYNSLLELLPANKVFIKVHDVFGIPSEEFLKYVIDQVGSAETYSYQDYPHKYDSKNTIDISKYLKVYPSLKSKDLSNELALPDKFVTAQWDSTADKRRLSDDQIQAIQHQYQKQGYQIITVGGLAKNLLLQRSLKHIGYAMSRAQLHIGVDSGFMHFAQMYLQPNQIHLYIKETTKKWSHHLSRARDNGCILNYYLKQEQQL